MRPDQASSSLPPSGATGCLVLSDGSVFWGKGFGALSDHVGEVCFNTSMTGYQEILTDPSYAGQIITFTFPHIGNVGCNLEDIETMNPVVRGLIIRADVTEPSNWRAVQHLDAWLKARGIVGLSGIDTRALTQRIRDLGAPNGTIVHRKANFDIAYLHKKAKEWPGLSGMDLAKEVSCRQSYSWNETVWTLESGHGRQEAPRFHVVAVDYGAKRNILRMLASSGCKVTVVPATATIDDIMHHHPDGVFLSNGPGDPAATGQYAVPVIKELLNRRIPLFGICLGHQLMGLALGGRTEKMPKGHRGANHPVKDLETGKVEITSQNHGFCVIPSSLPDNAKITHTSLFDNSCEGIRVTDRPAFCVQYHPEASPGPHDSHYLFSRFIALMEEEQINLQKSTKQVRIA
ncbi:MAG: glutamine-hydrolyzing carbamoyl-phosphate synthase small subunit [Dongiaceae bacterium]